MVTPYYVEYIVQHINKLQNPETITGFYILDYEKQRIITRPIIDDRKVHNPRWLMEKVMNEIKNIENK